MLRKPAFNLMDVMMRVVLYSMCACIAGVCSGLQASQDTGGRNNQALHGEALAIEAEVVGGVVNITLVDLRSGLLVAEGPYICSARSTAGED